MLDHFDPDGSHIPVIMMLFAEYQTSQSTSIEGEANPSTVSRIRTLQHSVQRIRDGLLGYWRAHSGSDAGDQAPAAS